MSDDKPTDTRELPPGAWERVRWTAIAFLVVLGLVLVVHYAGERPPPPETPATVAQEAPLPQPSATTPTPQPPEPTKPTPQPPEAAKAKGETPPVADKTMVKIVTDKGDITAELFDDKEPITAGSFLLLAESGFYNGLTFHRVEPGFCIQGGDPQGTGAGGPGFTIPDEVSPDIKHDKGILSMAKTSAPNSAGSQFYICLGGPDRVGHLNGGYAAFGKVTEGMEVAEKIAIGDKMKKVEVLSESPHAEAAREKAKGARIPEKP